MDIQQFWEAVASQNAERLRELFLPDAIIRWHNTNEQFLLEEYIRANCEYPGVWDMELERVERIDDVIITVARVFSKEKDISVHATSFIRIKDGKIITLDEYWGDDGPAPEWRLVMNIGTSIK